MRRTYVLLTTIAILVSATAARAADVVLISDTSTELGDGAQPRNYGSLRVWTYPSGAPIPAESAGDVQRVALGEKEQLFAFDLGHTDLSQLGPNTRIVAHDEEFALLAVADGFMTELDALGGCREIVRYVPPVEIAPDRAFATDPNLKQFLVDSLDQTRYQTLISELSGASTAQVGGVAKTIDNRYTYTAGTGQDIDDAETYITEQFQNAGYTVSTQSFAVGAATTKNIFVERVGTQFPNEVVVIGAHYDSRSESHAISLNVAPGAEDNASGTAAVIHLAEVFAHTQTARTVHFICFGGEEQGLYGSAEYVNSLASNGWTVVGALTMDMVAAWQSQYGVLIEGQSGLSNTLMQNLQTNVQQFTSLASNFSYNPFGSDHMPFIWASIPALLAIDLDWAVYSPYHTQNDTAANTDPALGKDIARGIAGTLIDLAGPVVDVRVGTPGELPDLGRAAELSLDQNHPNPFNPRTEIHYEVPRHGPASLRVFDLKGREIAVLASGAHEAGQHSAIWDGMDAHGAEVSSGLYFYRLEHDDGIRTKRMMLVK